jgi:hypothetical protein
MTSDIALSARLKASDRLVDGYIPGSFPSPDVSAANPAASAVQLVDPPRNESLV